MFLSFSLSFYCPYLLILSLFLSAFSVLPIHKEIETLPAFPRERLKLQRLLGSGAFGEVYEGVIVAEHNTSGMAETRVAVKVLNDKK